MGCFSTHASGTLDPPEVRNWRIHLIALIASMSALASKCRLGVLPAKRVNLTSRSGLRHSSHWWDHGPELFPA
jgi:hypothetical protein